MIMDRPNGTSTRVSLLFRKNMIDSGRINSALQLRDDLGIFRNRQFHFHMSGNSGLLELIRERRLITPLDPADDLTLFARAAADQSSTNADQVISSAALILAHSSLDDIVTDVCEIAIDLEPYSWNKHLSVDRKISIRDILDKGVEQILRDAREKYKGEIRSQSLPNRTSLLLSNIPIVMRSNISNPQTQHFKESKLREIDTLRNRIVHEDGIAGLDTSKASEQVEFMQETGLTVLRSLVTRFDIKIDLKLMVKGQEATTQNSRWDPHKNMLSLFTSGLPVIWT